ncbi:hypothetical protein RvY_04536 [Ramazzottius varieornatus]|uniref:Uncharacterized protein n=1 Tax=Ramazzottius varieornatus TaxID=947166 RepID=A0A1D1V1X0_RAMVA|nr:hypothetical protein RvY_04536 [Ramazzottius varieornatus]
MYPPNLWGLCERTLEGVWRTSNNVEAWHGSFGTQVDRAHPGIYTFLDDVAKERKLIKARVEALRVGGSLPPKDKYYQRYAQKLADICESYVRAPSLNEDFLNLVARNIEIRTAAKKRKADTDE